MFEVWATFATHTRRLKLELTNILGENQEPVRILDELDEELMDAPAFDEVDVLREFCSKESKSQSPEITLICGLKP